MKTYNSIDDAMNEAKEKGVKLTKTYYVNDKEVSASEFRVCDKPIKSIYRSGLLLIISK